MTFSNPACKQNNKELNIENPIFCKLLRKSSRFHRICEDTPSALNRQSKGPFKLEEVKQPLKREAHYSTTKNTYSKMYRFMFSEGNNHKKVSLPQSR